ncbi:MAG: sigma factor-like helix-turn-helix DNA-binding protein [Actinomycetota bacterium]
MPTADPTPIELVVGASFDAFYRAHHARLTRALSVALGDTAWGRDAADEAMTRTYERWDTVQTYRNPEGWTYRVGLNWALSWHRKLARRLPWAPTEVGLGPTADPQLDAALADLDPKYRAVVVCRYLLDWSTEQTADALDIPTGTVKSRLSTGLTHLRSTLESPEPSQEQP